MLSTVRIFQIGLVFGAGILTVGCGNRTAPEKLVQQSQPAAAPKKPVAKAKAKPKVVPVSTELNALAFSSNGQYLVVGKQRKAGEYTKGILEVWDARTRRKLKSWFTDNNVKDVDISSDNRTLVSGTNTEARARLWDIPSGRLLHTFSAQSDNPSVAFSPSGREVVLGVPNVIKVWDVESGRLLRHTGSDHEDTPPFVSALAISPNGRLLATSAYDVPQSIIVYDLKTLKIRWEDKDVGGAWGVAFSPDGRYVVNAANSGLYVRKAGNGRLVRILGKTESYTSRASALAFSPDGKTVADNGGQNQIRLWNLSTGKLQSTRPGIGPLAYSPDGKTLVCGDGKANVKFWNLSAGVAP